jgi:endonuclease/exonuclease/phosphatase family metal-dependent hydrolase
MLDEGTPTAYGPLLGGHVRIATWNLWWRFGPWEARQPAIAETLRRLDADIVCLQEVWDDGTANQAAILAAGLGYAHCYASRLTIDGVRFGNAVLSRWPIEGREALELPAPPDQDELRVCLRADVAAPFGPMQVFTTHLNWRFDHSAVRQEQVRAICRFVDASPARSFPAVLCGDLNAAPDSDEIRMLTGRAAVPVPGLVFHDAWEVAHAEDGQPGFSWSNANPHAMRDLEPSRRIDYVLAGWPKVGGAGHVVHAHLVGTEAVGDMVPSDHYGVVATLRC